MKKILWWYTKFVKWRMRHRRHLNIKGLYVCYYLIDKYILYRKPDDYFEEYEKAVTATLERMRKTRFFERMGISEDRSWPAFFTLGNYILMASKDMQKQIYDYLGDWPYKYRLEEYVKSGVLV